MRIPLHGTQPLLLGLIAGMMLGIVGCGKDVPNGTTGTDHPVYSCGPFWWRPGPEFYAHFLMWTPDGSHLIFGNVTKIQIIDAEGTQLRTVVEANPGHKDSSPHGSHAEVAPHGSRIVYATCEFPTIGTWESKDNSDIDRSKYNYEIATINLDGTGQERLTENRHLDHYPVFSPDGSRIAFLANPRDIARPGDETSIELFMMAADGTDVRLVASSLTRGTPSSAEKPQTDADSESKDKETGEDVHAIEDARLAGLALSPPVWSPNGEYLAFLVNDVQERPTRLVLFTVRANGTEATWIARMAGEIYWSDSSAAPTLVLPTWSPDGEFLAFVMADQEGDSAGVYTARPDGTDLRLALAPQAPKWRVFHVSWSPDGTELAILAEQHLFFVKMEGSSVRHIELPFPTASWRNAAWSPDGDTLAFVLGEPSDTRPPTHIYTVARDGTNLRALAQPNSDRNLAPANSPQ